LVECLINKIKHFSSPLNVFMPTTCPRGVFAAKVA